MSRYRDILEGKNVADIDNGVSYNYYFFVSTKNESTWVIMRENSAQDEFRFSAGKGTGLSQWGDHANLIYVRRNELNV